MKDAVENQISSAADLPYFEGDFWPGVLEECIKELEQEEEEKRRREEAEAREAAAQSHIDFDDIGDDSNDVPDHMGGDVMVCCSEIFLTNRNPSIRPKALPFTCTIVHVSYCRIH